MQHHPHHPETTPATSLSAEPVSLSGRRGRAFEELRARMAPERRQRNEAAARRTLDELGAEERARLAHLERKLARAERVVAARQRRMGQDPYLDTMGA